MYPMGPMVGYGGARMGPDGQPPPPAYGHEDWVPAYEPPRGSTKVNPDQNVNVREAGSSSQGPGQGQVPPYAGGDLGSRVVR